MLILPTSPRLKPKKRGEKERKRKKRKRRIFKGKIHAYLFDFKSRFNP